MISLSTRPEKYFHWRIKIDGIVAFLILDVNEDKGLFENYQLKLNSYDLGVDIELDDAVQRLRFEYPQVRTVILCSGKDRVFCAGANIRMLAGASHPHKVNFCKFTNETRNAIEDASNYSGQRYICAINGTAAGGGYELALAAETIILVDDSSAAVSLPEVPLLAVLPGTGGLTRVTDKRKVRRDIADYFCTLEEGVKGQKALDWGFVDKVIPNSAFDEIVMETALKEAEKSDRPSDAKGVLLTPLEPETDENSLQWQFVSLKIDRKKRVASLLVHGPQDDAPQSPDEISASSWLLAAARELDAALLHVRFNEPEMAVIELKTSGNAEKVLAHEAFMYANNNHWLCREIQLYWRRVLKRLDMTSRTLVAIIDQGSCFAGMLAEISFAADRSYMLIDQFEGDNRPAAALTLSRANMGGLEMSNDLTRMQTRFLGSPETLEQLNDRLGDEIEAEEAETLGLVTFSFDDIDWEDELRIFLEERASFSADALTGMEANLRFAGPETMETKIFGRLTAWQNWIFQRPNAVGPEGALRKYGSGQRPHYDKRRT